MHRDWCVTSPAATKKYKAESARALLAVNVLRMRNNKGWSQEALAFEAGLHRTFIAHVERQARNISIDNVERIATALGVPIADLLSPLCGDA
ncbi:helix-turn-helix domain-containing protein [Rhizobacter sp. Root404]|uniref:helix-turn-helix domain-containing protein n=1 Tax=Rhizobacter sp. Root404 TaxID=1736528 RepID=UPI0009E69185|nr:helix-turn-helix transcriptional regulator [Rhizobacter sp. Root404]